MSKFDHARFDIEIPQLCYLLSHIQNLKSKTVLKKWSIERILFEHVYQLQYLATLVHTTHTDKSKRGSTCTCINIVVTVYLLAQLVVFMGDLQ